MGWQLVVRRSAGRGDPLVFEALRSPWQRLRGLLGTRPDAPPVALLRCGRIHTLGMRYRIDVAFVGEGGMVLETERSVCPGCLLGDGQAQVRLERPHQRSAWFVPGETVEMELVKVEAKPASPEAGA